LTTAERIARERHVAMLAAFAHEAFICLQQREPDPVHDAERLAIYAPEAPGDASR
jgi:hypothetical protein